VEVCDTSQYEDRIKKPPALARISVPQYWVVDINRRVVDVYTNPLRSGRPPRHLDSSNVPRRT
jgi:Uma2 family endonuclease